MKASTKLQNRSRWHPSGTTSLSSVAEEAGQPRGARFEDQSNWQLQLPKKSSASVLPSRLPTAPATNFRTDPNAIGERCREHAHHCATLPRRQQAAIAGITAYSRARGDRLIRSMTKWSVGWDEAGTARYPSALRSPTSSRSCASTRPPATGRPPSCSNRDVEKNQSCPRFAHARSRAVCWNRGRAVRRSTGAGR